MANNPERALGTDPIAQSLGLIFLSDSDLNNRFAVADSLSNWICFIMFVAGK